MKIPASFKALKYVAQGYSYSAGKQMVRDHRAAKSLAIPGMDKAVLAASPKKKAQTLDVWNEKLNAQVAYYKKTGLVLSNPSLASPTYIKACRALGIDPVWDKPPRGYNPELTFIPYRPPLHLTKKQIFGTTEDLRAPEPKLVDKIEPKTVRFADGKKQVSFALNVGIIAPAQRRN